MVAAASDSIYCRMAVASGTLHDMAHPAPTDPAAPARWTVEQYLRLVDDGVLGPDDKVHAAGLRVDKSVRAHPSSWSPTNTVRPPSILRITSQSPLYALWS